MLWGDNLLRIMKRLALSLCFLSIYCLLIWRAIRYYINGQSIASAHLDGHFAAAAVNIMFAIVATVVIVIIFLIKREKGALKWFAIPTLLVVFALVHGHIGSLFYCCMCCCMPEYVHRWNIVILTIISTTSIFALVIGMQIRDFILTNRTN